MVGTPRDLKTYRVDDIDMSDLEILFAKVNDNFARVMAESDAADAKTVQNTSAIEQLDAAALSEDDKMAAYGGKCASLKSMLKEQEKSKNIGK
jgi:hypothetical protein